MTRKIKVLHCLNLLIPGGVERRRLSLFERLPRDEFEHRVICVEIQDRDFARRMAEYVVDIVETGPVTSVLAPARYHLGCRVAREWRPDIVHGAIIEGYTLASVIGRLCRVPVVVLEETSDPKHRRWKGHALARAMAAFADHCVGVSPAVGSYLTGFLRIPSGKVSVINNGVELPEVPSAPEIASLRASLGLSGTVPVIGSVGRMLDERIKRFGDLIDAFATVRRTMPSKLLLVGDGPERRRLAELATSRGVSEDVVFAGFQRQVGHFYALMDVFALASECEAFGLVVAEAMRSGLPVVATEVGGLPTVVAEGETGFLAPPRSPQSLARAIRSLLVDPDLRKRMGEAGRRRADREFSAERYASDVAVLYRRLLGERGA